MKFDNWKEGKTVFYGNLSELNSFSDVLLYSTALVGREVFSSSGKKAGEIKDFLFSTKKGRIEYVLLRTSKAFSFRKKYIAIPFELFEYEGPDDPIQLLIFQEALEKAPGFKKARLHEIFTMHYEVISDYWGSHFGAPGNPIIFN